MKKIFISSERLDELVIISKVTKNQGYILSLAKTISEKPHGGGGQIAPAVLVLKIQVFFPGAFAMFFRRPSL